MLMPSSPHLGRPAVPRESRVVVAGAGPAGCAAAIALARAGREVLLLEREPEAREVVCGEFLGHDALRALAALGLDAGALGATPIAALRIAGPRRETRIDLPFAANGLPRRTLDAALRARAVASGAELLHAALREAVEEDGTWRLRLDDGATLATRHLVLATGKHAVRGHARAPAPPPAIGLKLHLAGVMLAPEIVLLPCAGGYAGLQPLPNGGANLCAALRDPPPHVARDAAAFLAHVAHGSRAAARLLAGARGAWARPLAVAGVPYGFRFDAGATQPGLYRVGDQVSVIASLAGEGVALALHSGLEAAAAILAGQDARCFHAAWRRRSHRPMTIAGVLARVYGARPGLAAAAATALPGVTARLAALSRC